MTKNTKNIFKALKESLMLPIDSAFTIFLVQVHKTIHPTESLKIQLMPKFTITLLKASLFTLATQRKKSKKTC